MWNDNDIFANDIAEKFEQRMFCNFGGGGSSRDNVDGGSGTGGYDVLGTGVMDKSSYDGVRVGTDPSAVGLSLRDISGGDSGDAAYVAAIQANVDAQLAQQAAAQQQAAQQQAAQQQQQQYRGMSTADLQRLLGSQFTGIYPNSANLRRNIGTVMPSAASFAPLSYPQGALMGRPPIGLSMSMMSPSGVRGMGQIPKAPVYDSVTDTYSVDGKPIDRQTAEYMMEVRGDVVDALPSPDAGLFGDITGFGLLGKGLEFLTGETPEQRAMKDYGQLLDMGGEINPETGDVIAPTARGELKYNNRLGVVTYKGMPDPSYTGAYQNLINPPAGGGDDDGFVAPETTAVAVAEPEPVREPNFPMEYRYPAGGNYPEEGRFLRRGLLDVAPMQFGGLLRDYDPTQFAAMNVGFRRPTDVSLYQDPYDVTGYSLV